MISSGVKRLPPFALFAYSISVVHFFFEQGVSQQLAILAAERGALELLGHLGNLLWRQLFVFHLFFFAVFLDANFNFHSHTPSVPDTPRLAPLPPRLPPPPNVGGPPAVVP